MFPKLPFQEPGSSPSPIQGPAIPWEAEEGGAGPYGKGPPRTVGPVSCPHHTLHLGLSPPQRNRQGKRAAEPGMHGVVGGCPRQVGSSARLGQGFNSLLRPGLAGGRGQRAAETHMWMRSCSQGLIDAGLLPALTPTWTPQPPRTPPQPHKWKSSSRMHSA